MKRVYSGPAIAKELQRKYGEHTQVVDVQMRHETTVRRYIIGIEDAHKKASKSKLVFGD